MESLTKRTISSLNAHSRNTAAVKYEIRKVRKQITSKST